MKSVKSAFDATIQQAEEIIRRQSAGQTEPTKKERGYAVTKISQARAKKQKEEAQLLVSLAKKLGLSDGALLEVEAAAQSHAKNSADNWVFIMLSADQNIAVIEWLQEHSKRPHKAVIVWAYLLKHLRLDTGEIMATRQQLAERVEIKPRDVSSIMTELASINAIRREKDGRRVKYFLNAHIATHLGGKQARAKARENDGPLMQIVESGRDVVDDDLDVIE